MPRWRRQALIDDGLMKGPLDVEADELVAPTTVLRQPLGTRMIRVPGIPNVRDAGGLRGPSDRRVSRRLLLRGPAPGAETAAALLGLGIRTVVDLRCLEERRGAALPVHSRVSILGRPISADMSGIHGVHRPQPEAYLAYYRRLLPEAARVATEIIGLLAEPNNAPVYVCCAWGKDRTGVVYALVLRALRVRLVDIENDYALTARCYRNLDVKDSIPAWDFGRPPTDLAARTETRACTMRSLLVEVERGSCNLRKYLETQGLSRSMWRVAMRQFYDQDH